LAGGHTVNQLFNQTEKNFGKFTGDGGVQIAASIL
jgi:hypothetical protein